MEDPLGELHDRSPRPARHSVAGACDWAGLLRRRTLDGALREIAGQLAPDGTVELEVVPADGSGVTLARHRVGAGPAPSAPSREVLVPGEPPWRLIVRGAWPDGDGLPRLRELGGALSAWRAAHEELERQDRRLEARTRELSLLQDLGRSAAEARSPDALFRYAAGVLHEGTSSDVVIAACAFEGRRRLDAFLARPMEPGRLLRLAGQAGKVLGWAGDLPEIRTATLDGYDDAPGVAGGPEASDVTVVPVVRKGRPVAALAVVLPDPEESWLRVVFGAVNQLTLHLDRILTVREAEQDRFRSILDSMPQAVVLTDPELHVVQANPAASSLLERLRAAEGPLEQIGDLEIGPLVRQVLSAPPGETVEREARGDEGTIVQLTLSAVTGEGRRHEGLVFVMADVTERRRLQEQLARTDKLSSLGQMISGIAHELNNPLAAVLGYAQLVQRATPDEKLSRRLETIHDQARRCQKIVQNLLSFARPHEPERRRLSMNEVVGSVLDLARYPLRVDGIEVVTELDPDSPAIHGDGHQLQQAVLNLVTNAQHAMVDSGRGGRLTLRTTPRESDGVVLEVADDGPGIPAEQLNRIFDPFFTTKEVGRGTGLGLSLVYGIVTSHGGEIRCRSRVGRGTTFEVELPVGAPSGPDRSVDAAPPSPPHRTGHILVIDDEEAVARLICETLAADGHHVARATRRDEALSRLAEDDFDLVVVDLKVPGVSDESFRSELFKRQRQPARGVLFVSGDTVSGDPERKALGDGATVLHKPFDIDDLLDAVRSRL